MSDIITIARQFLFVREAQELGQNHGQRVNGIQVWSGGTPALNTSWCAWFATMVLDLAYQGNAPIPREGNVEAIRQLAAVKGWLTDTPSVGDLVLSINAAGVAHHVGLVTQVDPLTSIAGNTSLLGDSSNGDGVYEHTIDPANKTFIHYPRS